MRIGWPHTAREWHYYQHIIAGSNSILLILTGVFVGKGDAILAPIAAILTFISGRMSSEITFRIQNKLFEENSLEGKKCL